MRRRICGYLEGGKDSVSLADDAYNDGTLLDSFLCIFDLEDTALWRAVARGG